MDLSPYNAKSYIVHELHYLKIEMSICWFYIHKEKWEIIIKPQGWTNINVNNKIDL